MREEEEKERRANEFNGWDVCLRNSFLGVKSWFMVEGEGRGGDHEDFRSWTSLQFHHRFQITLSK